MVCPPNRVTEAGMEALLNDALPMAEAGVFDCPVCTESVRHPMVLGWTGLHKGLTSCRRRTAAKCATLTVSVKLNPQRPLPAANQGMRWRW